MTGITSHTRNPKTANASSGHSPLIFQIGTKKYAHPDYVADLLGVTRRTLNRWTQDRKGPPKIIIGQKALYDLSKLSAWLEANEINPLPQLLGNK